MKQIDGSSLPGIRQNAQVNNFVFDACKFVRMNKLEKICKYKEKRESL